MTLYPKQSSTSGVSYVDVIKDFEWATDWTLSNASTVKTLTKSTLLTVGTGILAGCWKFNENTSTTTADFSGNGHTGTLAAGCSWGAAKLGASSISITANSGLCSVPTNAILYNFLQFCIPKTFSLWVYVPSAGFNNGILLGQVESGGSSKSGTTLGIDANGKVWAKLCQNWPAVQRACYITAIGDDLRTDAWHHIIWINSGSYLAAGQSFYIDGLLKTGTTTADTNTSPGTDVTMNALSFGAQAAFLNGAAYPVSIDEVDLYNYALSSQDIAFLYNSGTGIEANYYPAYIKTSALGQINTANYSGIYGIKVNESLPANTATHYLLSVDGGTTYKAWGGASWDTVVLANIHTGGMTKTTLEALTSFTGLFAAGTLDIACGLSASDGVNTPQINQVIVKLIP